MKSYNIPTPTDLGYNPHEEFDGIIAEIIKHLNNRSFEFEPKSHWNRHYTTIKTLLEKSLWKLETKWVGSKDDGSQHWKITAI